MRGEVLYLTCPDCCEVFYLPIVEIEKAIKVERIKKCIEVVEQLQAKEGYYYEKWKAAMEKRGKLRRCRDCEYISYHTTSPPPFACNYRWRPVRPQNFACRHFQELSRSPS